jgi:hypothetical protein
MGITEDRQNLVQAAILRVKVERETGQSTASYAARVAAALRERTMAPMTPEERARCDDLERQ